MVKSDSSLLLCNKTVQPLIYHVKTMNGTVESSLKNNTAIQNGTVPLLKIAPKMF